MATKTSARRAPHPWQFIYSLSEAQEMGGPSPNKSRELIANGTLQARKLEGRWYIDGDSLRAYLLGSERASGMNMDELLTNIVVGLEQRNIALRVIDPSGARRPGVSRARKAATS